MVWVQYICDFTFNYPDYSEKVQTVIHELSHFKHIGDTNDNVCPLIVGPLTLTYGVTGLRRVHVYEPCTDELPESHPDCRSAGTSIDLLLT